MRDFTEDVAAEIGSVGDTDVTVNSGQDERKLRVAAIDDHALTLQGLKALLGSAEDMDLVGCFGTVPELLAATANDDRLDAVVLDLRLADQSDPAQNVLSLELVTDHVLILSSAESPYLVRKAVRTGVMGVVQKSESPETILSAVRLAASGKGALTTEWASVVDSDPLLDSVDLSERQREVLELYASGEPTKRVATMTGLTPNTVLDYLGRIRAKYAAAGRAEHSLNKSEIYRLAQQDGYLPGPMDVG
ncbi:response regulator transcription factor [Corynebacterium lactis]|uniref:Response regulator receiver n=1 Tax=Corynebacterium lactis RW2-5 TaxID=1408189 RepID=A0A0K2H111_9CORY|nr:response regulator transcription factor [Corynebacterium lactis]ALA67401.1 response regulator receiver [Corynebacterium lactis RW2-5]